MTVPTRRETEQVVAAIFGGGRVNRSRHLATSEPLPVGEVLSDLVAQAKRRHPSMHLATR